MTKWFNVDDMIIDYQLNFRLTQVDQWITSQKQAVSSHEHVVLQVQENKMNISKNTARIFKAENRLDETDIWKQKVESGLKALGFDIQDKNWS